MMANAVIRLKMPSKESMQIVYQALVPEAMKPATNRSRVQLKIEGEHLVLTVEAKDTVALRAALNAYLRWVSSLCDVLLVLNSLG